MLLGGHANWPHSSHRIGTRTGGGRLQCELVSVNMRFVCKRVALVGELVDMSQ